MARTEEIPFLGTCADFQRFDYFLGCDSGFSCFVGGICPCSLLGGTTVAISDLKWPSNCITAGFM